MPLGLACRIVSDVCAALAAAHGHVDEEGRSAPIFHRDVSPQNVLISRHGIVKLTDFGIAKAGGSIDTTGVGTIKGKIGYMAPERFGRRILDGRADVFAAGIVLFECLTNRHPFRADDDAATIDAILNRPRPGASEYRPEIPLVLDEIIARALSSELGTRYPTVQAMHEALEGLMSSLGWRSTSSDLASWLTTTVEPAVTQSSTSSPPLVSETRARRSEQPTKLALYGEDD
jgi:serine/threonine-protein kinase